MTAQPRPLLRAAVDYGPLVAFGVAFLVTHDLMKTTAVLVAASIAALIAEFILERRIAPLPAFTAGAAILFGGLALVFHDPSLIKMKLTAIYVVMGGGLLIGQALGKNPLKLLLNGQIVLPDAAWASLTRNYGLALLVTAAINEVVWRNFSDAVWVGFKIVAFLGLAVFLTLQLLPHLKALEAQTQEASASKPSAPGED